MNNDLKYFRCLAGSSAEQQFFVKKSVTFSNGAEI
jgi:hypothetical protein